MINFKYIVSVGVDPTDGRPVIGFTYQEMFIFDPFLSDCGRFQVDPEGQYGLPREQAEHLYFVNKTLPLAADDAIHAGCLRMQTHFDVPGDVAGIWFSGGAAVFDVQRAFAEYFAFEMNVNSEEAA